LLPSILTKEFLVNDTNWKNWVLLIALAVGISFELMKHFPGRTSADLIGTEIVTGSARPYSVRTKGVRGTSAPAPRITAVAKPEAVNVAALQKFIADNTTKQGTFKEGEAAGAKKEEKEKCDENHMKLDPKTGKPEIDPKTGKQVACKKKKKEKKKEEEKKETQQPPPPTDKKDNDIDSAMAMALDSGEIPQPVPPPAQPPIQEDEWERRLLNAPNLQETKAFIDAYQRNQVSAETFYKVVAEMLADPREQMKQMGVLCAGLTPSVQSFQLLAQLQHREMNGSPARRDAESFLARYADQNNLATLERILRASEPAYVTVLAEQKVDQAATRLLTLPSASTGATVTAAQVTAVRRNATYFQRFLGILQDLTARSTDSGVKSQAGTTLSNIERLLTIASNTPVPGQPGQPGQPTQPGQQPAGLPVQVRPGSTVFNN
jgi:hypothetical protein